MVRRELVESLIGKRLVLFKELKRRETDLKWIWKRFYRFRADYSRIPYCFSKKSNNFLGFSRNGLFMANKINKWMDKESRQLRALLLANGAEELSNSIGHFRVHLSLHFKAKLIAKSLLWKSVFIHIEIGTDYHNKNFALRLALKERLKRILKWPIPRRLGRQRLQAKTCIYISLLHRWIESKFETLNSDMHEYNTCSKFIRWNGHSQVNELFT